MVKAGWDGEGGLDVTYNKISEISIMTPKGSHYKARHSGYETSMESRNVCYSRSDPFRKGSTISIGNVYIHDGRARMSTKMRHPRLQLTS